MAPRPDARGSLHLVLLLLLAALSTACKEEEPRALWGCDCTFITDTDGESKHAVEVCAGPAAEVAAEVARGCAQSGAPGPVQACKCSPTSDLRGCSGDVCRMMKR